MDNAFTFINLAFIYFMTLLSKATWGLQTQEVLVMQSFRHWSD